MAKKKKPAMTVQFNPEFYIKTRARSLDIYECYCNKDWQMCGMANILVVRRHPQGTYTLGMYLVDTYCLGVKDSFYLFSIDEASLDDFSQHYISKFGSDWQKTDYNTVHNIIYGAVEYAEDLGIKPCKEWSVTQYILEDDTEDVPLIEFEFGKNGKPFLCTQTRLEASRYIPILNKTVGEGNYDFIIDDGYDMDDDIDESEEDDEDDDYAFSYMLLDSFLKLSRDKQMLFHGVLINGVFNMNNMPPIVNEYSTCYKNDKTNIDELQRYFEDITFSFEDITIKSNDEFALKVAMSFFLYALELCKAIDKMLEDEVYELLNNKERLQKYIESSNEVISNTINSSFKSLLEMLKKM